MKENDLEFKLSTIIQSYPWLIVALKKRYATDAMWESAIVKDPTLYQFCPNPSNALTELAVHLHPGNLEFVPVGQLSERICKVAVSSDPDMITKIPQEYRTDDLLHTAFDIKPSLMSKFQEIDEDYVMNTLSRNPGVLTYLRNPSECQIEKAVRNDPNIVLTKPELLYRDDVRDLLITEFPEFYASLSNHRDTNQDLTSRDN